jgi:cytidine deaminase
MEIIKPSALNKEESGLLKKARTAALKSTSDLGHKIGCVVKCRDGAEYYGATNIRTRIIGSTCAEREAFDQMYFAKNSHPLLIAVVGRLPIAKWRPNWSDNKICTPCGLCLEMMRETVRSLRLKDLDILCSSWDKKRVLRARLSELFPQID